MNDKDIMFAVHIVAAKGVCSTATANLGMSDLGIRSCNKCPWNGKTCASLNYASAPEFRHDRALTYLIKKIGKQKTKELLTEILL
jgi:hypothetical protein